MPDPGFLPTAPPNAVKEALNKFPLAPDNAVKLTRSCFAQDETD
jgi:hypothetical protein